MSSQGTSELDLVPAGIVFCDALGRMAYLNETMLRWLSADTSDGYIGRPIYTLFSPAGRIYFETHLRPMLMIEGRCSEISLELAPPSKTRQRIYLNGNVEHDADGQIAALHFVCFEGADRHRYEQELLLRRRQAEEYEAIVAASPDAIIYVDPNLKIVSWNAAAEHLLGYSEEEVLGKDLHPLTVFDEHLTGELEQIRMVKSGAPVTVETTRKHKDGKSVPVEASISWIKDEHGDSRGFITLLRDISERKRNEQTIKVLNQEILHRSKNLLAVVSGIATMTLRYTPPENFSDAFGQRLSSLGKSLSLFVDRTWDRVELGTLVRQQLDHLGSEAMARIDITGPTINIGPDIAEALGMAIFELSTNALKYGALSVADGRIAIHWQGRDAQGEAVSLVWRETGVRIVEEPKRQGFGSLLTGHMLEATLSGEVNTEYTPVGLSWRCDFSL